MCSRPQAALKGGSPISRPLCLGQRGTLLWPRCCSFYKGFLPTCSFTCQPWFPQSPQRLCPFLDPCPRPMSWPRWDVAFAGSAPQVHLLDHLLHWPLRQCPLPLPSGAAHSCELCPPPTSLTSCHPHPFLEAGKSSRGCRRPGPHLPTQLALTGPACQPPGAHTRRHLCQHRQPLIKG